MPKYEEGSDKENEDESEEDDDSEDEDSDEKDDSEEQSDLNFFIFLYYFKMAEICNTCGREGEICGNCREHCECGNGGFAKESPLIDEG